MSICISTHCKKYATCKLAHPKDDKIHQAINWHDTGSHAEGVPSYAENNKLVSISSYEQYDCGEYGAYAMYEPMKITNNERLINMTLEERAKWLVNLTAEQPYAGAHMSYWNFKDWEYCVDEDEAVEKAIEWLNSEVDD